MVQRKVINKLGIQPECCKNERLSVNLKPSSIHHQDVKSGDVKKKKMKKSGSVKRPEVKTPQGSVTTPNYMKTTTSSDARKEKPSKTPQTSPQKTSYRRKSTSLEKLASSSDKKVKTLARTTSLKLTSTPSFKVSAKKCSPVALCEKIDVQRATCSSTLKDCKFPTYLTLSPGGTELEGTSAMKVCPYTYCSLNGHRLASLPPLKSFLSAKRWMIKTQRNVKLGCLSPRGTKSTNQLDLNDPTISSPLMQEEQNDFFVEIYAQNERNDETQAKSCEEEVEEMVSEGEVRDKIDTNQFLDKVEDENQIEENSATLLDEEEAETGFFSETDSEVSDLDLETGNESPLYLDDGYEYHESCVMKDGFFIKLDENVETCFNVLENEVSRESFDEDIPWYNSDEESINGSNDSVEIVEENLDTVTSVDASANDENQILNEDQPTEESEACNSEKQDTIKEEYNQESHLSDQEMEDSSLTKATTKSKKPIQDSDESDPFNPRGPNFLPLEPELEGENVDLRHQELDERRNAEEWMVDYALRKVVTKLGVERKRKVALLVEAFEKVIPMTKCEINLAYSSAFESPRPILTCN